jgi:ubiquinone/menaquinone biosynthesis C-methylase UbiE
MRDPNSSVLPRTGARRGASAGTTAVRLAWGTWRVSITRAAPTDADLTQTYDRASARWSLLSTLAGYSAAYPELFAQLRTDGWLDQWSPEACVLDCGTGTGALIRALPADHASGLHVHGVDRSPGMLARAAFELGRLGHAVQFHRADVRRLPFPSDRVDLVMSAHVLEHLPDPLEGLREMTRVLRPGGTLLVVTTRPSAPEAYLRLA